MTAVRRLLAATAALAALGAASGCTNLGSTGGDKQYIASDGVIVQIAPSHRGKPVSVAGEDLDGQPLDLSQYRGKPVVLTVWGSWCTDCRKEMPSVVSLASTLAKQGVPTVGIDIREPGGDSAARAYADNVHMDFPSFYDPSSSLLLRLSNRLSAPPCTAVLDSQGRLAAMVIGPIPGEHTVQDVVHQVAAGG